MRVLFSSVVSYSIFHSQVPLARALRDAGHEVAFATGPEFGGWVRRVGFPTFPVGLDGPSFAPEMSKRFPGWWDGIRREEHLRFYLTNECARFAAPMVLRDLVPVVEQWAPDLLVHDTSEFAGPVAATLAGIPYVNHGWGLLPPLDLMEAAGEAAAPLWEERGLEPAPSGGMFKHLYLDVAPPSIQDPEIGLVPTARPLRPVLLHFQLEAEGNGPATGEDDGLPTWFADLADRPLVYVALGTIFNTPVLFSLILESLREEPVNVLVSLGHKYDPAALGPQPPHVRIEPYLPQSRLLPHCDVAVTHAGSATTLAALSAGVPMVLLPQGSDQYRNAERCMAAGVARGPLGAKPRPEDVRHEIRAILADSGWEARARSVGEEIRGMPSPAERVPLLEHLAAAGSQR